MCLPEDAADEEKDMKFPRACQKPEVKGEEQKRRQDRETPYAEFKVKQPELGYTVALAWGPSEDEPHYRSGP